MPFPIILGIQGALAVVRLGQSLIDRYNNGTLTQEEFDREWNGMKAHLTATMADWEAHNAPKP